MSLRLGALYDALRTAQGVSEKDAREAAEEVAAYSRLADLRRDVTLLKWMMGALIVLTIIILFQGFTIMGRLP